MDHTISAYSGWLIPALAVIVLLVVAIKVVNAVVRFLSLVLVAAILFGGYMAYGRLTAIQNGVNAVAIQHIKLENEGWERDTSVTEPTEPSLSVG